MGLQYRCLQHIERLPFKQGYGLALRHVAGLVFRYLPPGPEKVIQVRSVNQILKKITGLQLWLKTTFVQHGPEEALPPYSTQARIQTNANFYFGPSLRCSSGLSNVPDESQGITVGDGASVDLDAEKLQIFPPASC